MGWWSHLEVVKRGKRQREGVEYEPFCLLRIMCYPRGKGVCVGVILEGPVLGYL